MKKGYKYFLSVLFLSLTVFLVNYQLVVADPSNNILAKIDVSDQVNLSDFQVYAYLQGSSGKDYIIVKSTASELKDSNSVYEVIDHIGAVATDKRYVIALERLKGARQKAAVELDVLLDDGRNIVSKITESEAVKLIKMGFEIEWLSDSPLVFKKVEEKTLFLNYKASALTYDPVVEQMMNLVTQTKVNDYTSKLTGEEPVNIGGSAYTIATRNTYSGTALEKATQFVYEFMGNQGLFVSYHNWSYGFTSNRNVVGEKTGIVSPDEIVLITAHLDCMPSGSVAPGADDNGSGSVGVMLASEILNQYDFERTIRFVFFTGEEQGLYGSKRYADKIAGDNDNIVAVYNMDMIAWDDIGGPTLRIHTRSTNNPGYAGDMVLANTFVDVVNAYNMNSLLTPIIDSDGITASDHSSFWNKGYSAILAIEDDVDDFCDYYHTTSDTLATLNMDYYTNYIKASIGTSAHLAKLAAEAQLTAGFTSSANLLEVSFQDQSTVPSGSSIVSYQWNFGDNSSSSDQNPVHTYAAYGTYEVVLTVEDNNGNTDSVSKSVEVTQAVIEYCASAGDSNYYEWISQVDLGNFSKTSGASGYSDFTTSVINLTLGQSYPLALSPSFRSGSYTEYWKVWIDFNNDGDFDDSGEEVFSNSGSSNLSGNVSVSSSSSTGERRMRVSMKYGGSPPSCGSFDYGEVEDYTINIQN
ncbi:MAG: M20/M25/M40 family metallo-hydrolase [Desulfobacteraceae bacterium]|nr:M20/M25/M40 family metallo-hydrolase [Desulfobacteraceae bacterium]